MKQKILIFKSTNVTPESEMEDALEPLIKEGYNVASATTSVAAAGTDLFFVTTVLLQFPPYWEK